MNKKYKRNCPLCNRILYYSRNSSKIIAGKKNSVCFSCANKGENNPMFGNVGTNGMSGKHQSPKFRQQLSKRQTGRKLMDSTKKKISDSVKLAMWKPDVRKKCCDALSKTKWIKAKMDVGQLEMLNKWNRLGFNFEPNYQLKTDLDLFYIDGYDKENNVVLEYDGKYHKKAEQKKKDLIRQQKIIDILNPKRFWRYDVTTKQIKNILETPPIYSI